MVAANFSPPKKFQTYAGLKFAATYCYAVWRERPASGTVGVC